MNTSVTVSGMQVKTKVSNNILIAADTLNSTAKKDDSLFESSLSQEVKGYLEPVSTINAENFFYTLNAKANGALATGGAYKAYDPNAAATNNSYANLFSQEYGVAKNVVSAFKGSEGPADAYVDYVFQLKAVATEAAYLNLSNLYLIDGNPKDASKAYRVAVFTEDITSGTATPGVGTKQIIYTESGAANQTSGQAVGAAGSATAAVSYNTYADTTNNTLARISVAGTKYYKVVVRMWLEGEDTTCYNDMFLPLTNSWSLDLEINLNTANTSAASNITKIWTGSVDTTPYWYDGTNVYTTVDDAKAGQNGTAKASAAEAVKTLFGIQ